MGVAYIDELRWLDDEIAKVKKDAAQLDEQQRKWGLLLEEQRKRNEALRDKFVKAEKDLAKAREDARKHTENLKKAQEDAARKEEEKSGELEALHRESIQLSRQKEETKQRVAPILVQIDALNTELEQLQKDIEMRRNALAKSELLPKEVECFQTRLTKAMALKPGLLQKTRFAEELLAELGDTVNPDKTRLLVEYRELAERLRSMEYEQQGV